MEREGGREGGREGEREEGRKGEERKRESREGRQTGRLSRPRLPLSPASRPTDLRARHAYSSLALASRLPGLSLAGIAWGSVLAVREPHDLRQEARGDARTVTLAEARWA